MYATLSTYNLAYKNKINLLIHKVAWRVRRRAWKEGGRMAALCKISPTGGGWYGKGKPSPPWERHNWPRNPYPLFLQYAHRGETRYIRLTYKRVLCVEPLWLLRKNALHYYCSFFFTLFTYILYAKIFVRFRMNACLAGSTEDSQFFSFSFLLVQRNSPH